MGGELAADARRELEPQRRDMVDLLGRLVSVESPSDDLHQLNEFASVLSEVFGDFGPIQRIEPDNGHGPHLQLSLPGEDPDGHDVVLCHYDTVWPLGTLQKIPFSVDEHYIARGPGCFDMKGGIVVLYFALRALQRRRLKPARRLEVLFTSDEEVGSPTSRPLIELAARGAQVAYVLESPLPGGTLKTARKGTGDYALRITGRAAHAGVEPQKGISAISELAHQIQALHALNDYSVGTTLNVGVVCGGTRPNVVAAEAEALVDFRVERRSEADRVDAAVRGLRPVLKGATLHVEGGLNRPPMERTEATMKLYERARDIAAAMGVQLEHGSTGGGSDGNFTAALGVPTLDGLGVEGEGAHAAHEHVVTESFPRRAALFAGLIC